MRKTFMITFVLLISTVWLPAQDAGQGGLTPDTTSLKGCLQSAHNNYTLTDENGTTYQLAGAANKLGHQVNRQVEVTGKPGLRMSDSTLVGAASGAREQQVFEVKTVKRIADACK